MMSRRCAWPNVLVDYPICKQVALKAAVHFGSSALGFVARLGKMEMSHQGTVDFEHQLKGIRNDGKCLSLSRCLSSDQAVAATDCSPHAE
eukprot:1478715-Amphidinium_carterae.1